MKKKKTGRVLMPYGINPQKALEELESELKNISKLGYYNVKNRTAVITTALGGFLIRMNDKCSIIITSVHKTVTGS